MGAHLRGRFSAPDSTQSRSFSAWRSFFRAGVSSRLPSRTSPRERVVLLCASGGRRRRTWRTGPRGSRPASSPTTGSPMLDVWQGQVERVVGSSRPNMEDGVSEGGESMRAVGGGRSLPPVVSFRTVVPLAQPVTTTHTQSQPIKPFPACSSSAPLPLWPRPGCSSPRPRCCPTVRSPSPLLSSLLLRRPDRTRTMSSRSATSCGTGWRQTRAT